MGKSRGEVKVLNEGQIAALAVVGSVFAVIGLGEIVVEPLGAKVFGAVLVVFGVAVAIRSARLGVHVDESGIAEQPLGRARRMPWCAVSGIELRPIVTARGRRKQLVAVALRSGEDYMLTRTAAYPLQVQHQTAARMAELLAAHRSTCGTCL